MTEEIAATPGWVEEKVDELFARLPRSPEVKAARDAYLTCLASSKSPGAPSDLLGAEFNTCRSALLHSLGSSHVDLDTGAFGRDLEALEAEIDTAS